MDKMQKVAWWRTHIGEREASASAQAIGRGQISQGPLTAELEARLGEALGTSPALCVPSASMGLLLTLSSLGIGPGDEVIVPALTWIATAHAASTLGARVRLADCLPERPCMDPRAVERLIGPRTKAIISVHLGGRAAPLGALMQLAEQHGLTLIEDAAQAFSSSGPEGLLGTIGHVGVFSLGLAKLVSTGQGGAIVCRDPALMEHMRLAKCHGVHAGALPDEDYRFAGFNMKFSDLLASVGLVQLSRLEAKRAHVRSVYTRYSEGLQELPGMRVAPIDLQAGELPLWTELLCQDRAALEGALAARGIETRRVHRPLGDAAHLLTGADAACPHAERFSRELLILPSGPAQPLDHVDHVIETLAVLAGRSSGCSTR